MSKIVLSNAEFRQLANHFKAPKEGAFVKWREFSDSVDEIFTKKGLEKSVEIQVGDARTQSFYGRAQADGTDEEKAELVRERFRDLVRIQRLNAKSFFQDHDRHNHFVVSPKKFKQILTLLGVAISDDELVSITKLYANQEGAIQYLPFINDTQVLSYVINDPFSGAKSTYRPQDIDFTGAKGLEQLMQKIRDCVKRNRIRVGEFF
jgi:hypothetical protein